MPSKSADELEAKAAEVLAQAQQTIDPTARLTYLDIAEQYRAMAQQKRDLESEAAKKRA